jgi:hypothetical protein
VFIQDSGAVSYTASSQQYHRDLLRLHVFRSPVLDLYKKRTTSLTIPTVERTDANFL